MSKPSVLFHSIFILTAMFLYQKSFSEPQNLSTLKNELIRYHDSGEYMSDVSAVMSRAEHYLTQAHKRHALSKKPALVLDIDETCLSNYNNLIARDFINDYQRIHRDTMKGDATPIQACLKLYKTAQAQNIDIFFISGRYENERGVTIKNLNQAGFKNWKGLYLQPNANFGKRGTIENFKMATRKKLTQQGYTILASIGDQPVDLNGGYTLKTFKVPNPYYFCASHFTTEKA
jgi:predicted secreted acid phosphatase